MFLGLNHGGGGMLDFEFFKKNFLLQIHFYQMLILHCFFFIFVPTGGLGRVET